jgi:hypothetical protein
MIFWSYCPVFGREMPLMLTVLNELLEKRKTDLN